MNLTKVLECKKYPLLQEEYFLLIISLDKAIEYAKRHKEEVLEKYYVVTKEEMDKIES